MSYDDYFRNDQVNPDDIFYGIIFIFVCGTIVCCCRYYGPFKSVNQENTHENDPENPHGASEHTQGNDAAQNQTIFSTISRQNHVLNSVIIKKVTKSCIAPFGTQNNRKHKKNNSTFNKNKLKEDILVWSIRSIDYTLEPSLNSEESLKSCSICLENYKEDDTVCWSKNDDCLHAFHLICMTEWLMNNNNCPMCRANYLEHADNVPEPSVPVLDTRYNYLHHDENGNISLSNGNMYNENVVETSHPIIRRSVSF